METGRDLDHTTERHQRGFKVPMETGSVIRMEQTLCFILDVGTGILTLNSRQLPAGSSAHRSAIVVTLPLLTRSSTRGEDRPRLTRTDSYFSVCHFYWPIMSPPEIPGEIWV